MKKADPLIEALAMGVLFALKAGAIALVGTIVAVAVAIALL